MTGRPVRFYWGSRLFFRRLTGDGRVDACGCQEYPNEGPLFTLLTTPPTPVVFRDLGQLDRLQPVQLSRIHESADGGQRPRPEYGAVEIT
ncbi:hypothetical protein Pme01_24040 [Planosporangium mesophilum]|uniref:Uncharacterized protein n=1 Tax=Planosporangium mesophilum TaxID=689768 RepID=A0A8J3X016_9ACTN|nr:hypothetical protein Pme01_24040 [Planosporangium mesophilum]